MYNLLKKRTCQGCGYEAEEQDYDRGRHDNPPEDILKKNIVEGILVLSHDLRRDLDILSAISDKDNPSLRPLLRNGSYKNG